MKTWKSFPKGSTCMLCNTNDDRECTLIGRDGTVEGNNEQAEVVHLDCILKFARVSEDGKIIYVLGGKI